MTASIDIARLEKVKHGSHLTTTHKMITSPQTNPWRDRPGHRQTAPTPAAPADVFGEDSRLGSLDLAILTGDPSKDFAARCRALIRDAIKRGVANYAEPRGAPQAIATKQAGVSATAAHDAPQAPSRRRVCVPCHLPTPPVKGIFFPAS